MNIFNLPDLGEGLPNAEIREWYIKEGDDIERDQPMLAVETAKALIDIPAPFDGTIEKRYGEEGDTITTGNPLVGFKSSEANESSASKTVVGSIEETNQVITSHNIDTQQSSDLPPSIRALVRRWNIDVNAITTSSGTLTKEDVIAYYEQNIKKNNTPPPGMTPLPATRQAMALSMTSSQQEVVATSIFDTGDINNWDNNQNMTIRMMQAIISACEKEPILNSHLDYATLSYQTFENINLAIAVDTKHGLYAPVIKDLNRLSPQAIREKINHFKKAAQDKAIQQDDLTGATITLSNFGVIAGIHATPIIVPPSVAIIGVGKSKKEVVATDDNNIEIHTTIPISLSFDHRLVTGGEAARFLKAMTEHLSLANIE